jgi:transcriptional regulator with XRE-family HTH domain
VSLAKNLVRLRKESGLSLGDMAKKLGKSKSSVSEYEAGDHKPPLPVLKRYASVTGADFHELLSQWAAA